MSSVAVATAAFAGLSADAQDKASTQKAEHDHFSERTRSGAQASVFGFFCRTPDFYLLFRLVNGFAIVKLISYYSSF
jgi:hypothetical protein